MSDEAAATPIRFNDLGEGWHLAPPRRFLRRGMAGLFALLLFVSGVLAVRDGNLHGVLGFWSVLLFVLAINLERHSSKPARMYESPNAYGLLLPTHPVKASLIALLALVGTALCLAPIGLVVTGLSEGEWAGRIVGSILCLLLGVLFVAGAAGGIVSWRTPQRGILLTVDGVALQTQKPPATFAWHQCSRVRAHWTRVRGSRNTFLTPDDRIANWVTFEVDPDDVTGRAPHEVYARTREPSVDVAQLAMAPELALEVCRFYLEDAQARAELRTTAALDRVASIERSLGAPG